jgi:flagellin-like protein
MPDRSFNGAAVVLIAFVFVLGVFYHPILDVIRTGLSLL